MWVVRLLEEEPTPLTLFEDVDSDLPYAAFVQTLYDVKVTFGCHSDVPSFCPNRLTTKGEMAAFVARAYDLTDTDPAHTFPDVAVDHVFADNISALINADITAPGCSDGATFFCVDSPMVAAQAVEWLHKASQSAGGTGENDNGTGDNGTGEQRQRHRRQPRQRRNRRWRQRRNRWHRRNRRQPAEQAVMVAAVIPLIPLLLAAVPAAWSTTSDRTASAPTGNFMSERVVSIASPTCS